MLLTEEVKFEIIFESCECSVTKCAKHLGSIFYRQSPRETHERGLNRQMVFIDRLT